MTNDLGLCHQIPDQLLHFLKHSAEVTPENDFTFFANDLLLSSSPIRPLIRFR